MLGPNPSWEAASNKAKDLGLEKKFCSQVMFKTSKDDFWSAEGRVFFKMQDFTHRHMLYEMLFAPKTKNNKRNPHSFFVLKCCWESDSVLNLIVKAVSLLSQCVCTSHLLPNIKRLKSSSSKLGSLKAIFLLSIELELLLSLMQIKVKLFYFFLKGSGKTNVCERA